MGKILDLITGSYGCCPSPQQRREIFNSKVTSPAALPLGDECQVPAQRMAEACSRLNPYSVGTGKIQM